MKNVLLSSILTILLTLVLIEPSSVSAEQAAAEQYRQMFRSGNFYVECQIFSTIRSYNIASGLLTYAGKDGMRMQRTTVSNTKVRNKSKGGPIILPIFNLSVDSPQMSPSYFWSSELTNYMFYDQYSRINPKKVFNNSRSRANNIITIKEKKYPDVMYKNGKYYRIKSDEEMGSIGFRNKKSNKIFAMVLSEDKLDSPYLDPDEEWQYIKQDLSLPDELAIFYWEDKFHQNPFGVKPYYNGNSKRTIDEKEYDCDQYLIDIKTLAGTNAAREAYNMLYENGQLVMIQKYLLYKGKEKLMRTIKIGAISSEVPEEVFEINQKCKIYAAGTGDMNELIGKKVIVEEIGGKEKK